MNSRSIISFLCSLSFLFFFSCSNQVSESNQGADTLAVSEVNVTLRGIVTSLDGYPVPFVTMTSKEGEVETDSLGEFVLKNPKIEGNRYVVKFSKEGFYDFIYSKEYIDSSKVSIVIVPRGNNDISRNILFQSKKGIDVNLNGMVVQIPSDAMAYDDTGEPYDGMVQMDMLYLNPDSANFKRMMPGGDLLAVRSSRDTTFLVSCGMVNVLLSDENGRKLQLRKSLQAALTYPIPASLQKTAPDTMPLWFFDEQKGLWKEEGYALKSGNVYKGSVNHFTWWNGDFPQLSARVNLKVTTKSGIPLANGRITLRFNYLKNAEELNSRVWYGLPEKETAYLDNEGCSKGYVPAGTPIDFICMGDVIGRLEPLEVGQEVDLSLICSDVDAIVLKFEDKVGNPLSYLPFKIDAASVDYRSGWTNRDGYFYLLYKPEEKVSLSFQSEKIASFSGKKWKEAKVDTQAVVLDFLSIDGRNWNIKGSCNPYTTVFFYDGKKEFSFFLGQRVLLPVGRKYDVVVSGFKVGEIPKTVEKGQKFAFDFYPLKVVNSRSSEKMDYYICLTGRSSKHARPVQIAANSGYELASSPIVNYMKEITLTVFCNEVNFSISAKRKNGYFEPMVIDLAKVGALFDEVDFYRRDSLLLAHRLSAPTVAYVEKDTAYYYFKDAVLKSPTLTKDKKAENKAVFSIKNVCYTSELPVKMKLLKDGKVECYAKAKVLYLKDSSMVDMEMKLRLPAVALGSYEKSSQLSVSHLFPELPFPMDFVYQHSYESWSNLYACKKEAPYSVVEKMRKTLESKDYDEHIVKQVKRDDYEEYWYSLLTDSGESYQVNIRYSKEANMDPSKQKVKFIYDIPDRGKMESSSTVENCPLKSCQLFIAYSKMNVVGSGEVFQRVREKEKKDAELAEKQAKRRRR
ncbi:MAG: carboxypeptidase regulatory-like domain-containing protein [Paludibacteraceae bacterium]|nr:carboxypeptidase regulatory-like domain-containing protein [Paludibacteraceae bacterium]